MLSPRIAREGGTPLWAMGAPIVGVPLMVALLALMAPAESAPRHCSEPLASS